MEPTLLTACDDAGVATVTVRHPAKRNAMTPGMWRRLPALLAELAAEPRVRVLVLTGAEGTFCAGADIGALRDAAPGHAAHGDAADGHAAGGAAREQQTLAVAAEEALAAFPKPTLAAVRGHCVGGGCQLAAACDLRFASHDALFGITPARLGLVYPASSTELPQPPAGRYPQYA